MRRRQPFEHRVALDSPDESHLFIGQIVQCRPIGVARVDSHIDHPAEALRLPHHLVGEPFDALGRVGRSLSQDGMHEAVSQAITFVHGVVIAGHRVAGDQRMVDRIAVVAVVCRARLMAVHLDRKAVDVHRDVPRGMVAAGGPQMPLARLAQRIAEGRQIAAGARQDVDQPRLRGLAGHSLVERLLAGTVPGGQLHRRVVSQAIGVVLSTVAEGQGIHPLAHQLDQLIPNQVLPAWIMQPSGQPFGDAQPMIGLAQQKQAAIRRDPIIAGPHLDRPVERRLE